ncbi:DUF3899 domain-containing protein [Bacillus infantis]|uniref:DUF3899 domain-containing protein n=1 Tax=Bacillus infantis TaxID=324767 RepID=UPI0021550F47|nr:DUF3899 domain-containing protein [Bacillus infantis]MCR6611471.1 DUF3899 domain-containing protein [Bacillus infantis]
MKWKITGFLLITCIWLSIRVMGILPLLDWINLSFIAGIAGLSAAVIITIFKTGFLSLFFRGFRTIGTSMFPRSNAMERTDSMVSSDYKWQEFKAGATSVLLSSFLIAGLSSMAVSLIGLCFY